MASERVRRWDSEYSLYDVRFHNLGLPLEKFLIREVGLVHGELWEWTHTTRRRHTEFLEDFCSRNEGRPWADSLRKDLEDWGYF